MLRMDFQFLQWDVAGKSPGPHKIGARMEGGRETIVFSPRAVFEALCHTITQLAALCGTNLDQFDYFVVAGPRGKMFPRMPTLL